MNKCDCCGNTYDKAFQLTIAGATYTFDCFECAIHRLAPACHRCGCRIVGHGVEARGSFFCSAHCAKEEGVMGAIDRVA